MEHTRSFWRWMLALAVATMLARGASVAQILNRSRADGVEYYATADTGSYVANSYAMFDERPMSPIFRERIAYPFLLALARWAGLEHRQLLWLTVPLEVPAVLAMAWLGWLLSRRKAVAALGALLFAASPNAFQHGATLLPDWLNAQVMLMGIALLLDWALEGRRKSAVGACILLPLAQLIRPTLFPVVGPVVLLLAQGFRVPGRRAVNAAICASVMAYPALSAGVNHSLYGVARPMLSAGFQLHHSYVSYVRALRRNAENPQSMTALYFDEKHNVQLADPREVATGAYGHGPIRPDFAENYNGIVESARAYLLENKMLWAQAAAAGIRQQLFAPPAMRSAAQGGRASPAWQAWMRRLHLGALFFATCGAALLVRRLPVGVALFYAGCTGLVVLASAASWHYGVRVRLLAEILYTPVLAAGLLSGTAWKCAAATVAAAYLPRRLLRVPHAYVTVVSAVATAATAILLLRRSGAVESKRPKSSS